MTVETISETIQKFDGVSYYKCGPYFQRKGVRLHRKVWEQHNGPIPEGYDVHHIDGDRSHNNIENLQLMQRTEHHILHGEDPARKAQSRQIIRKAIEASRDWHSSESGTAWHSKHAKEYWKHAEQKTYTCTNCGKEFQTPNVYGQKENRFCSNNCKSAWRRKQGYDNETRTCPVCGKDFAVNRYSKKVCCGYECARRKRWGK